MAVHKKAILQHLAFHQKASPHDVDENSVLIICAHSDDQIFGPGGTAAKYAKEGKKVYTIILSYGEVSHFWIQKHHAITTRVQEALEVDKVVGGSGVFFLGITEGKFLEQWKQRRMYPKLKRFILKYRPARIFTHSVDDPHHDHRAVNKIVIETLDRMKYKCEVYMFDIWNVFNFKKRRYAKIIVDISSTFALKIKALRLFRSQWHALFSLMWSVYFRAWIHGKKINTKYGEAFYKIR